MSISSDLHNFDNDIKVHDGMDTDNDIKNLRVGPNLMVSRAK
jgi:hypothetical protein